MSEFLNNIEENIPRFVFDGDKKISLRKVRIESIPDPENIIGLVNISGRVEIATSTPQRNNFEIGEDVYILEDGRVAKTDIPFSRGIEITG